MSDPIDRQAAIDAMTTTLWHYPIECLRNINQYEFAKGLAELGLKSVPSAQPEPIRTFSELVVEYPNPELCTYKEYRGKPYYSIKYIENGERHIGYGTYNPEVLSQYLKEYFISSAQPEQKKGKWIKMSDADGEYYACSVCGGELQRILLSKPTWDKPYPDMVSCDPTDFCPNCGARLEGKEGEEM